MAPGSSCSSSRQVLRCCELQKNISDCRSAPRSLLNNGCHANQGRPGGLAIHYERPDIKLHSISAFPCWNITELWKIAWLDGLLTGGKHMLLEQRTTVAVKSGAFFPLSSGRGPCRAISMCQSGSEGLRGKALSDSYPWKAISDIDTVA